MSKRRLSLITRDALGRIVRTAVDRSLDRAPIRRGELSAALVLEILRAVRREGRSVQGMSRSDVLEELERANHELVQERDRAQRQLDELNAQAVIQRRMLAETHDAMVAIVDGGAAEREEHALGAIEQVFDRAREEGMSLEALREHVNRLVLAAARRERQEVIDGLGAERDRQIDVLERRLAKLNKSLELSEQALRELAARKDVDPGIASLYRSVQGLDLSDPNAGRKQEVLEQVFLANVELRSQVAAKAKAG